MHETYMLPFAEAVREGSASIMCSYNKINGTAACESPSAINLIKKVSFNEPDLSICFLTLHSTYRN
jgi:beta-glucosidase-like glycosyl hydrolase